ncbi:hypothetical protein [uncultured Roseibium sp.]|uniref:hypothetical protein n=1 Tax=uncultured Roseibium sp. TaxID=1936171 RepID=UPI0032178A41
MTDTSVLVNFLRIDRMDLIGDLSTQFLVTDHAAGEICEVYEEQQARFEAAVAAGCCEVCRVEGDAALEMFGRLTGTQRLGIGESATIAHALSIGAGLALDDRRAANEARRIDERLVVLGTAELTVQMIREGLLSVAKADTIKDDWAANHRFRMKVETFRDLL